MDIFGIPVTIEIEDDKIFVTDHRVNMFGVGMTAQDAVENYKSTIRQYFEWLQKKEATLGTNLKEHLRYLRTLEISHIERR